MQKQWHSKRPVGPRFPGSDKCGPLKRGPRGVNSRGSCWVVQKVVHPESTYITLLSTDSILINYEVQNVVQNEVQNVVHILDQNLVESAVFRSPPFLGGWWIWLDTYAGGQNGIHASYACYV